MNVEIREYTKADVTEAVKIWNEVVEEGNAFPQTELLDEKGGHEFFHGSRLRVLLLTPKPKKL